ncbi:MAG TPA: hypothetical protein VHR72_04220 [Gemmataceae bacterium]|jgi:hypothetical protein|nr:hypothetical protein [Gemmataceae bacterium]
MLAKNRVRRIFGFVLIVLGTLLDTRMLWMWMFLRNGFGDLGWLRFWVLSWFGVVLLLTGCWLAFPSRLLGTAVVAAIGVPVTIVIGAILFEAKMLG